MIEVKIFFFRLYPQTGRKHQLRSHCAYVLKGIKNFRNYLLNHHLYVRRKFSKIILLLAPILGDDKYRLDKIDKTSTRSETSFEPMYLHLNRLVIHVRKNIYI